MKNINRYGCGNGEGMFDDKEGYWVTHEDYKQLLDKYEKLALTIPVVSQQSELLRVLAKHISEQYDIKESGVLEQLEFKVKNL